MSQALPRGGGALRAGVHDARAGPLHQRHRLQGPRPRLRRTAGQRHHPAQHLAALQMAAQMPVQAQRPGQPLRLIILPVGRDQPAQRGAQVRVLRPQHGQPLRLRGATQPGLGLLTQARKYAACAASIAVVSPASASLPAAYCRSVSSIR